VIVNSPVGLKTWSKPGLCLAIPQSSSLHVLPQRCVGPPITMFLFCSSAIPKG
jgi:hypothetical protein